MAQKKFRIRYKRLIIFLIILIIIILSVIWILNLKITNIYVSGNDYLSDQEIIELAGIENYPSAILCFSNSIESKIKSSSYITDVVVKKSFTKVYITVNENRPIFYDSLNHRTVLADGSYTNDKFNVPILKNIIDDSVYGDFLESFVLIDSVVLNSISEISYAPKDVDNKLFLFTMIDGNYVYANTYKFSSMNKYFDMVSKFNNHKGILYLDSGEYFKILDN